MLQRQENLRGHRLMPSSDMPHTAHTRCFAGPKRGNHCVAAVFAATTARRGAARPPNLAESPNIPPGTTCQLEIAEHRMAAHTAARTCPIAEQIPPAHHSGPGRPRRAVLRNLRQSTMSVWVRRVPRATQHCPRPRNGDARAGKGAWRAQDELHRRRLPVAEPRARKYARWAHALKNRAI